MRFMHLWPLALLILIPLIILMYLLKQKAVDMPVPSVFLWKEMYQNKESDTPWEKLKKNILLIMQIITVIVLIFALMGPYIRKETDVSESVAILIDNSAGMGAMLDERDTRLEKAKASAAAFVDTLPPGTKITLISCSRDTSTLISNSTDKNAVISLIKSIKQTNYVGDVSGGIKLCETLRVSESNLQVAVFSDTPVQMGSLPGTLYSFAGDIQNACVDFVSVADKGNGKIVMASVSNCGSQSLATDLNLYADDKLISVMDISLEAGESGVFYFENLAFEGNVIKVEINRDDALMIDNAAYTLSDRSTGAKALLLTSGNLFLQRAMELEENLDVIVGSFEDFETYAKENYDLIVFDNAIPENLEKLLPQKGNLLFINVPFEKYYTVSKELNYISSDNSSNKKSFVPTVSFDSTKYTHNIESSSFAFSSVKAMDYPIWAENLLTVRDEYGTAYSAGFIGETDYRKVCALGFDLHASDLVLKMEFPVFIYSLMTELADTSALSAKSLYCGDTVKISALSDNGFTLSKPKGPQKNYSSGLLNFRDTDDPGVYVFNEGKPSEELFVVNFPTIESKNTTAQGINTSNPGSNFTVVDATEQGVFSYRPYIIGLILLLLLAEWILFIRK